MGSRKMLWQAFGGFFRSLLLQAFPGTLPTSRVEPFVTIAIIAASETLAGVLDPAQLSTLNENAYQLPIKTRLVPSYQENTRETCKHSKMLRKLLKCVTDW